MMLNPHTTVALQGKSSLRASDANNPTSWKHSRKSRKGTGQVRIVAVRISSPGTPAGPCKDCAHTYCVIERALAGARCGRCRKPIGYDRGIDMVGAVPEHAICDPLKELERERELRGKPRRAERRRSTWGKTVVWKKRQQESEDDAMDMAGPIGVGADLEAAELVGAGALAEEE